MQPSLPESAAPKRAVPPWCLWAAAGLSAGLLELPFPLAGPMPPWRSVFAWFGLAPLIWAVLSPACTERPRPLRRAFLLAYVCGVLWFMGNCYWIYDTMLIHGGLPPAVSVLILLLFSMVLGLYFGIFGWGLQLVRRVTGSTRLALLFAPFLWVALELTGARFTSVPWDQLGYSQVDIGTSALLAPWTGVYGISFVIVAMNALNAANFLAAIQWRPRQVIPGEPRWRLKMLFGRETWAVFCGGLIWFLFMFGVFWEPPKSPTTSTAVLIQPDLDVEHTGYWSGPGEWEQHIADFIHLGGENCKTYIAGIPQTGAPEGEIVCPPYAMHPDLIVWPESPAPFFEQDPRFQQSMADVVRAEQAPLVVNGVGSDFNKEDNHWRDYVSAMVFDAGGKEVGRYDKIHLVPWGEYVPFHKFFFFARKLTGKVAAFTPGDDRKVFHLTDGQGAMHRYGIFICYEAVFADEIRQFAKNGAEVFVTGSDDGWYGDTSAPWQLLNMARMRAMENRRWILRATNDGITAAIDPYGRVRQSIPRHKVDALPAEFGYVDYTTFYSEHGDVFAWLCAILSIAVVGWAISKRGMRGTA
jgi:apolipoprotein N-acyltransferase